MDGGGGGGVLRFRWKIKREAGGENRRCHNKCEGFKFREIKRIHELVMQRRRSRLIPYFMYVHLPPAAQTAIHDDLELLIC